MIIPGMILAGGQSRRMGGADKAQERLGGRRLIDIVAERFSPQVSDLAVNANGDAKRFSTTGLSVVPDDLAGNSGPLAGVLTAMEWAAGLGAGRVVTVSVDAPFLPGDLVPQLMLAAESAAEGLAIATSPDDEGHIRLHPTFGIWPVALRTDLRAMLEKGLRKMQDWTGAHLAAQASFPRIGDVDPFFNINTPEDLERAGAILKSVGS